MSMVEIFNDILRQKCLFVDCRKTRILLAFHVAGTRMVVIENQVYGTGAVRVVVIAVISKNKLDRFITSYLFGSNFVSLQ